jgi:hypothetical protein
MSSDEIAGGILKIAAALVLCFGVVAFVYRDEWVIYPGIALFLAGSIIAGLYLVLRDAFRLLGVRGLRDLSLRFLHLVTGMSAVAVIPSILFGALLLFSPDRTDSLLLIAGGVVAMVALGSVASWCDRQINPSRSPARPMPKQTVLEWPRRRRPF